MLNRRSSSQCACVPIGRLRGSRDTRLVRYDIDMTVKALKCGQRSISGSLAQFGPCSRSITGLAAATDSARHAWLPRMDAYTFGVGLCVEGSAREACLQCCIASLDQSGPASLACQMGPFRPPRHTPDPPTTSGYPQNRNYTRISTLQTRRSDSKYA